MLLRSRRTLTTMLTALRSSSATARTLTHVEHTDPTYVSELSRHCALWPAFLSRVTHIRAPLQPTGRLSALTLSTIAFRQANRSDHTPYFFFLMRPPPPQPTLSPYPTLFR